MKWNYGQKLGKKNKDEGLLNMNNWNYKLHHFNTLPDFQPKRESVVGYCNRITKIQCSISHLVRHFFDNYEYSDQRLQIFTKTLWGLELWVCFTPNININNQTKNFKVMPPRSYPLYLQEKFQKRTGLIETRVTIRCSEERYAFDKENAKLQIFNRFH